MVKNPIERQEMQVQCLGQEDPPGKGNDNSFQYSCLGNPMDIGALRVTVRGVVKKLDVT